jgi:hypothetical protein
MIAARRGAEKDRERLASTPIKSSDEDATVPPTPDMKGKRRVVTEGMNLSEHMKTSTKRFRSRLYGPSRLRFIHVDAEAELNVYEFNTLFEETIKSIDEIAREAGDFLKMTRVLMRHEASAVFERDNADKLPGFQVKCWFLEHCEVIHENTRVAKPDHLKTLRRVYIFTD